MSQWFKNRRQEFIAATLRQFGQIRRADLMREFDISLPQASNDISEFLAANPALVRYDVSAKAYVLAEDVPDVTSQPMFLIWSNEHRAWWRPQSAGYTIHSEAAGRYPHAVALRICASARDGWRPGSPPPEVPVAEADVLACETRYRDLAGESSHREQAR